MFGRIAGWNNRCQPLLTSQLHIGDQLLTINGCLVVSASHANAMLKSLVYKIDANLVVKRLPHATAILMMKNNSSFDDLGLEFVGGTAEASAVIYLNLYQRDCLTYIFNFNCFDRPVHCWSSSFTS